MKRTACTKLLLYLCAFLLAPWSLQPLYCEQGAVPGLVIDLRDPTFSEDCIETTAGGVIRTPEVRLQAQKIIYRMHDELLGNAAHISAEGEVRLVVDQYQFIARKLEYDLISHAGTLYDCRSAHFPWFLGGRVIKLLADGSFSLYDGFLTTSESECPLWLFNVAEAHYCPNGDLSAKDVSLRLENRRLLWLPRFSTNIKSSNEIPIRFTFRWGGNQGSRIGLSYELYASERFTSFVRLDYNFKRGPGGGLEAHYYNRETGEKFESINYVARDKAPCCPHIGTRYRLQGIYSRCWDEGTSSLDISYDKLSDQDMVTDYIDRGLELAYARRTQLFYRQESPFWMTNVLVRPRINPFQTIKQELPTLSLVSRPYSIFKTPVIADSVFRASYLDFKYENSLINVDDYTAVRLYLRQRVYWPIDFTYGQLQPMVRYTSIFYGNSPQKRIRWLQQGECSLLGSLFFSGQFEEYYHLLKPYFHYRYSTFPSVEPEDHFIFDIEDGLYRTNTMRVGLLQYFLNSHCWLPQPRYILNSYFIVFFDNDAIPHPIPRLFLDMEYQPFDRLKNRIYTAWDFTHGGFAHLIFRTEWTINDNAAMALEYRQRNAWDWRKDDRNNFNIDFFRNEEQLLHSQMSDRRKTLLLHLYVNLRQDLALEWESRMGWDRRDEPNYFEYDINFHVRLPAQWRMKVAYQHTEYDDRFAVYFNMGSPPERPRFWQLPCK